uniref:Uncharacterized protein n=1 Tax=Ciona savignyi TaxID=51511 RepID=H2Z1X0_CIOSA
MIDQYESIEIRLDGPQRTPSDATAYVRPNHPSWKNNADVITDTYIAYITTAAVVVISTAFLIAAFGLFKWATNDVIHRPSASFIQRTPPPY